MPARSISWWEAISASFGVSRRLGRKNRERRMDSSLRGRGSETGTTPETQGQEFGQEFGGGIFLPFEVGSLVTIARRSITNASRNPGTAISETRFRESGPSLGRIYP